MKNCYLILVLLSAAVSLSACGDNGTRADDNNDTVVDADTDNTDINDEVDTGDASPDSEADSTDADSPDTAADLALRVSDQLIAAARSDTVTIDQANSDGVGWVVVHEDAGGAPGNILGHAALVSGPNGGVQVTLERDIATEELLHAMLHIESEPALEPAVFDPDVDVPATDDGPVAASFTVTLPTVSANDQSFAQAGTTVTVDTVRSAGSGWIVIYDDDDASPGAIIGQAAVGGGNNTGVEIDLARPIASDETLWALLHVEDPVDNAFTFNANSSPDQDPPAALALSGDLIMDSFEVRVDGSEQPSCAERQPTGATATAICEVDFNGFVSTTNCLDYSSVFGREFPGVTGQGVNLGQSRDTYFSMEFSTASLTESRGFWVFETPQISPTTTGNKIITISKCPGDFHQQAIESEMGPDCYLRTGGINQTLSWKRTGQSGARCELELGQTYYFNMIYTTDPAGTPPSSLQWDCQSSSTAMACGNIVAPSASN